MSQTRSDQLPFVHIPLGQVPQGRRPYRLQSAPPSQPPPWPSSRRINVRMQQHPANMNTNSDSPLSRQRRKWFSTEMHKQRAAFTNDKDLLLFAGTWNVNGRAPEPTANLEKWLFPHENGKSFDVYMLGLQEVQPLSGVDALRTDLNKGKEWRKCIMAALGGDYDKIAEHQLVGIMVFVFVRKNHLPYLSEIRRSYAATGFLNAVGNKGGVAIRFQLYNQTISCVACHLSAHTENVERRNQDFRDVVRKAVFTEEDLYDGINGPSVSAGNDQMLQPLPARHNSSAGERQTSAASSMSGFPAVAAGTGAWLGSVASQAASVISDMSAGANAAALADPNSTKIMEHDAIFWLGDLNYRVDAPLNDVMRWIKESNWDALYRADQLQQQMKTCEVFTGFKEGPLRFPPTYKFDRYSDKYAVDENGEMKRVPAYTDRILWKTGGGKEGSHVKVRLQDYSSAASVYSSDHRPVYAAFKMTFGVEDVKRKRSIEDKVNKDLDTREASFRPALQFSSAFIDFGDVFFNRECTRKLDVRNLGGVAATVTITTSRDKPKWLIFDESKWRSFEILPGKLKSIDVGVHVTGKDGVANRISAQSCMLESILHVSAEPGRLNERIHLRGRYVATTLGLSLESLSMVAEPVLSLRGLQCRDGDQQYSQHQKEPDHEHRNLPGPTPLAVPKELWLLVDALTRVHDDDHDVYMNRCPGLFLRDAEEVETQRVLSFIDRGEAVPEDISGYAVAACMLDVLQNLDEPVVPRYATKRAVEAGHTEDPEMIHAVVDLLPPLNANVFWYVIGFLCETPSVRTREDRGQDIAEVFGRVLLATDGNTSSRDDRYRTAFILGAIRYQQRVRAPAYTAIIDLAAPESHPKKLDSGSIG